MGRFKSMALALVIAGSVTTAAFAQDSMQDPMVGGAAMYPSKNIVQNAMNSPDHTTLVALVKKAGLVATLEGPGPFTVFAPTNAAFAKLPQATVDKVTGDHTLLVQVLTYHVVPGRIDSKQLAQMISDGGGKATLKTVDGESLTASMNGNSIVLTDAHGGMATITTADVYQSNGVIHVIDSVLVP